jgi:hypothetical protein
MSLGTAIAVAARFVWLGMVLAISFIEAPLKFRAHGVTLSSAPAADTTKEGTWNPSP